MFSDRLKFLRQQNKLTQKELSKLVGVSQTAISMMENAEREPNIKILMSISDYFGVSIDFLLGKSDSQISAMQQVQGRSLEECLEEEDLSEQAKKDIRYYIKIIRIKEKKERNLTLSDDLDFGD